MYGQLISVIVPWSDYGSFIGEAFSADSGWISSLSASQSDSTGWCIHERLVAADKYWFKYVEGFAVNVAGLVISFAWSAYKKHKNTNDARNDGGRGACQSPASLRSTLLEPTETVKHEGRLHFSSDYFGTEPLLGGTDRDDFSVSSNERRSESAFNRQVTRQADGSSRSQGSKVSGILLPGDTSEVAATPFHPPTTKLMVAVLWQSLAWSYIKLSTASVALLTCVKIRQGDQQISFFLFDGTQECSLSGWQLPALLMLLLLVGAPLLPLCLLGYQHIRCGGVHGPESYGSSTLKFLHQLVPDINPFRKGCWFWCYLMPLHRLMVVLCANGFLVAGVAPLTMSVLAVLYCMFMLLLSATYRPYSFRCTNFLEIFCNIFLLLLAVLNLPNSAWVSIGKFPEGSHVAVGGAAKDLHNQWEAMNVTLAGLCLVPIGTFLALMVPAFVIIEKEIHRLIYELLTGARNGALPFENLASAAVVEASDQ
jgi:hypothetical protein